MAFWGMQDLVENHLSETSPELRAQTFFQFYQIPTDRAAFSRLPEIKNKYASLKRVSLVYERSLNERPRITSSCDAIAFFKRYWSESRMSDQERFVVACLDTKKRVQSVVEVTMGTLDASLVHPREVFKPAFIEGSSSILLSHNHPSGDPTPSRADVAVTDRLTEAGKLLGIDVLDHIIYGDYTGHTISIREVP